MNNFSRTKFFSVGVALSCAAPLGLSPVGLAAAKATDDGARPSLRVVEDPLFDVQQPAGETADRHSRHRRHEGHKRACTVPRTVMWPPVRMTRRRLSDPAFPGLRSGGLSPLRVP